MKRTKRRELILVLCILSIAASAQTEQSSQPDPPDEPKIQDNSFLVEEAYNQEYGVVQHIQAFTRDWETEDWIYTFTQEWPIDLDPRHQFSYTVPFGHNGDFPGSGGGMGPVLLNYRYQLIGNGDSRIAFSPRISAILPTGDHTRGQGPGGAGVAVQLPLSAVVNRKLVTHWNVGTFIVPGARNEFGDKAATYGYNFGQSFIWTLRPRVNPMLETVFFSEEDVIAPGQTQRSNHIFLNPGIRWAYNLKSGMQIVPGVSVPVGVGPSRGEVGVFFYLSIEHVYRKIRK